MMLRLVAVVVALLAMDVARAEACAVGSPCTKYKRQQVITRHEVPTGYTRALRGSIPRFDRARIAKFIGGSRWLPMRSLKDAKQVGVIHPTRLGQPTYNIVPAAPIVFMTADAAANHQTEGNRLVIERRIEKQGAAILIEVDHEVFRLAACPQKPGYACLLRTELTLAPIAAD